MIELQYRFAMQDDVPLLAEMNQQLICDEGHRNKMTLAELEGRMSDWLHTEYTAVIFGSDENYIGYTLYRKDTDWIYLRQFFVKDQMRRQGIGREAILWLQKNAWKETKIVRIDVLVNNSNGMSFWHNIGFEDYCITMEMKN